MSTYLVDEFETEVPDMEERKRMEEKINFLKRISKISIFKLLDGHKAR